MWKFWWKSPIIVEMNHHDDNDCNDHVAAKEHGWLMKVWLAFVQVFQLSRRVSSERNDVRPLWQKEWCSFYSSPSSPSSSTSPHHNYPRTKRSQKPNFIYSGNFLIFLLLSSHWLGKYLSFSNQTSDLLPFIEQQWNFSQLWLSMFSRDVNFNWFILNS